MGLTNFPNGISSFGVPVMGNGVPATFGTPYFIDYRYGSDGNRGISTEKAFKTLTKAETAVESNHNDVILIDGDQTVTETAMVDFDVNRTHIIGLNGLPGYYGQGAKVSLGITEEATDIATFKNTGVRNTFANIKFMNSNTVAEGLYCVAEGGEYSRYFNCEIYKSTDYEENLAAELLMNGDSSQFYHCTIGSTVLQITTAKIRPCVLLTRETITGKVCRDALFEGCIFQRKCDGTANRFVYGANANDVERMLLFNNCIFWNDKLATQTPAQNVAFGASLTDGYVLLNNCASIGAATAMSTTTGVFICGYTPDSTGAAAGIAIQCA